MFLNTLRYIALGFFFFLSVSAKSAVIVDTGTPFGGPNWSFNSSQWFAGEFNIAEAYSVNSLESYFGTSQAGNVTVTIHSDGGNIPGGVLYSANLAMAASSGLDWYGISDLDWSLDAGTYWASFTPDSTIYGIMPGTAPNPLDEYAQNSGSGWLDLGSDYFDYYDIGFRITAESIAVPEPSTLALASAGLLGLGFARRRKKQ